MSTPETVLLPRQPRQQWLGKPHVKGRTEFVQMLSLTICVAGLQFTWGVEQSYVNIFLLSLGMSKSMLSVVWAAGPITGLFVQPIVGALSDNSTSKYGRRRPFMMIGSVMVTIGLCSMAWAPDLVSIFGGGNRSARIVATCAIILTDIAINGVQACCRAIIVDTLPASKQEFGNGWAGRMIASGHLAGYFLGTLNLVGIFRGVLGDTQLKAMCVLSSVALIVAVSITSYSVTERIQLANLNTQMSEEKLFRAAFGVLLTLRSAIRNLPTRVSLIFATQFCSWYGWFSFLFYSSTWVSEVYEKSHPPKEGSNDRVGDIARVGSMSLVVFSTVSLICSLVLPTIMRRPKLDLSPHSTPPSTPPIYFVSSNWELQVYFLRRRLTSLGLLMWKPLKSGQDVLQSWIADQGYNLIDLWFLSHLVYAAASFMTGFVSTVSQATFLVAICGFSWTLVTWAPFSLLAEEIHALAHGKGDESDIPASYAATPIELTNEDVVESMTVALGSSRALSPTSSRSSMSEADFFEPEAVTSTGEQSGAYLGIHNVAVSVPQLFSTLISGVIFSLVSSDEKTNDGGRAIAYTIQLGSIAACGAAYFTYKLRRCPREG